MIIPIEPLKENEEEKAAAGSARSRSEKGFAIVGSDPGSPRARFERRAEEIARAAESHVRTMVEQEARLLSTPAPHELEPVAARRRRPGHRAVRPEEADRPSSAGLP